MSRQKPRNFKTSPGARRGKQRPRGKADSDGVLLYGLHAVEAALANPDRPVLRPLATENAAQRLAPVLAARKVTPTPASPRDLDRLLGPDTVHQGVTLETEALSPASLDDLSSNGVVLVLDQVTDPQNVGAVLRSAAAFGASGLILTERHSPPLSGALAKAASGALDTVPVRSGEEPRPTTSRRAWRARLSARGARRGRKRRARDHDLDAATRAGARRRGQRPASAHARALRPSLPHHHARRSRQPQRVERGGGRAALGEFKANYFG